VTPVPGTRSYASSLGSRVGALLGGLIVVPLVAIGVPLLLREVLRIRDSKVLIAVCISILVIGALWVIVHVFVTGPVRIETDPATVRLRRGLRHTNEWPRATTVFSSLVVRNSTNGIPTGANRTMIATTALERTEVPCTWFSAATFNDLMADLAPVSEGLEPVDAPGSTRDFVLDPAATRLRGMPRVIVTVLLAGFFVVLAISAYFVTLTPVDGEALIFIAAIGLMAVLVVAIVFITGRRRASRIPRRIVVTGSTIQVDDRAMNFGQLASIVLTPPAYSGKLRKMTLVETAGQRTTYALGAANPGRTPVFADYEEFVALVGRNAAPGSVRFDLS